jgi:hypothetical protein
MRVRGALGQNVNFAISAFFILVFGLFLTITVVHAIGSNSSLFQNISTPIDTND